MPNEFTLVAVEATKSAYRVLRHEPSGTPLDENGRGIWPADQFTFRLREDGAINVLDDEAQEARATAAKDGAEAKAHAASLARAEAEQPGATKSKKG